MAMLYYNKIKYGDGSFTLKDVPEKWRNEVWLLLENDPDWIS